MVLSILLVLLIILGLLSLLSIIFYNNERIKCTVPGPKQWPIIGNGHSFLGDSSKFLKTVEELVNEFGDTITLFILTQRYVFISKPEHVEAIMSKNEYNTKADDYSFLHPWLGQGLLTAAGERWRTHRKLLTPAFHFNILKTFLPIFLKNDEIFIKKLTVLANGETVDIFPIIALLALDNVSEAAMGVCINAQSDSKSKYVMAVNDNASITFARMRNMFLRYDFLFQYMPQKRQQEKALNVLHGHTNNVIKNRRKFLEESNATWDNYDADIGIKKKCAFLDLLLLSSVEGAKMDDVSIREEVDTFLFEGHDTTSSGLSFAAYCISQHSSVQNKLYEEQQRIFGEDLYKHPTYSDLNEMKYLEAVIKESLRLYPSVPYIARKIISDTRLGEHVIPKNTSMMIGIINMQRNPDVFEDPLVFRPERFENLNSEQKSAYNWVAFSAGPRNCIGQKFALMEMKVVLSSIIKKFRLLPCNIEPKLCADLILRSQNGVQVKILPRT